MLMLPKHGITYSIFLLAYTARLSPRKNLDDWVGAARAQSSYLASAVDLKGPAQAMIGLSLAMCTDSIALSPKLHALTTTADRATMLAIARLLLCTAPPVWLRFAVSDVGVVREYIPSDDLQALDWLEPDLNELLLDAYKDVNAAGQDALKKSVGDAAELFLMSTFVYAGLGPRHVARWSDAYGYDIEIPTEPLDRIEVKAASPKTSGRFFITRNEYEKSKLHGSEWRLLQVVFSNAAFVAEQIDASHVEAIYELSAEMLSQVVPKDTKGFVWKESAELMPESSAWSVVSVVPDPSFSLPGFRINKHF
jgi:hypothetical protein